MIINRAIGISGILVTMIGFSLVLTEKMGFLINPDYYWLVAVSIIFSFVMCVLYTYPNKHSVKAKSSWQESIICMIFLVIVVCTTVIPIKPLGVKNIEFTTKSSYAKRTVDTSQIVKSPEVIKSLSLVDWRGLLNTDANAIKYNEQKAEFNGFVSGFTENGFGLSTYQVSCCVVDATINTINMISQDRPPLDSWQKVNGRFDIKGKKPNQTTSFTVDTLTKIENPLSPYSTK
jgi:uncharacterized repeat protein (TIGR03943 family)